MLTFVQVMPSLSHLHTYGFCLPLKPVQFCTLHSRDDGLAEGPAQLTQRKCSCAVRDCILIIFTDSTETGMFYPKITGCYCWALSGPFPCRTPPPHMYHLPPLTYVLPSGRRTNFHTCSYRIFHHSPIILRLSHCQRPTSLHYWTPCQTVLHVCAPWQANERLITCHHSVLHIDTACIAFAAFLMGSTLLWGSWRKLMRHADALLAPLS